MTTCEVGNNWFIHNPAQRGPLRKPRKLLRQCEVINGAGKLAYEQPHLGRAIIEFDCSDSTQRRISSPVYDSQSKIEGNSRLETLIATRSSAQSILDVGINPRVRLLSPL